MGKKLSRPRDDRLTIRRSHSRVRLSFSIVYIRERVCASQCICMCGCTCTYMNTYTRTHKRRDRSLANEPGRFLNSKQPGHLRPRTRSSTFLLIFASESCLRFLRDPISTRKKRISFTGHVGTNNAAGRYC